jgi:hypothetical protein
MKIMFGALAESAKVAAEARKNKASKKFAIGLGTT